MRRRCNATCGHRTLAAIAAVFLSGSLASTGGAAIPPSNLISARSQSGQFIIYSGRTAGSVPPVLALGKDQGYVQLEPNLVAVSCERIKQILLRELGASASWRGTIYVVLYPARGARDGVTITSERFKTDWHYRVDMPDAVDRHRYVRVITQVLVAEMANRTAEGRVAEIPSWLVEGLTQLLLTSSQEEIILSPPRDSARGVSVSTTNVKGRKENLREQAQKKLGGRVPLSFDSLSWPTDNQLYGDGSELYAASAMLFVGELLRLPDGRACLRDMLAQLPRHYNWQFAFLGAFSGSFARPLDVERWWALARAQVSGRDATQVLSLDESQQKLDQATRAAVQVRTGTNQLPLQAEVPLQTVIRDWESVEQARALHDALRNLSLLRLRVAPEYVTLVQDYQQAIQTYLDQRDRSGAVLPFIRKSNRRRAVSTAIEQLNALDSRRDAFRPTAKGPMPSNEPAAPPQPQTRSVRDQKSV